MTSPPEATRLRELRLLRRVRDRMDREFAQPLDVEALARGVNLSAGHLSVTEVCFAVGCQSLGTFSTRFAKLVGMPPSAYRRAAADQLVSVAGLPACEVKRITRPVRNREAPVGEPA